MQLVKSSASAGSSPYCERQSSIADEYWPSHSSPQVAFAVLCDTMAIVTSEQAMSAELRRRQASLPGFRRRNNFIIALAADRQIKTSAQCRRRSASDHSKSGAWRCEVG